MEISKYNKEQFKQYLEELYTLEYIGIRLEDIKVERDSLGFVTKQIVYYSVPESCLIDIDNEEFTKANKSLDDFILFAKNLLTDLILGINEEDNEDKDMMKDVKENLSEYFNFRVKVRKGEVWTRELGKARLEELNSQIKARTEYKEV